MNQSISSLVIIGQIEYGLSANWVVLGVLPYLDQTFRTSGTTTRESGLGDLSLVVGYTPTTGVLSPWRFRIGAGLTIPIGTGVKNPISSDRNLVSDTIDPLLGSSFLYMTGSSLSLDGGLFVRPILATARDGTRTGSFLQGLFNVNYGPPASKLTARLGIKGIYRRPDLIDGDEFVNSGGSWLYLAPGLTWLAKGQGIHGFHVALSTEIPLFQNVHGTQLVEGAIFMMKIFYGLGG